MNPAKAKETNMIAPLPLTPLGTVIECEFSNGSVVTFSNVPFSLILSSASNGVTYAEARHIFPRKMHTLADIESAAKCSVVGLRIIDRSNKPAIVTVIY